MWSIHFKKQRVNASGLAQQLISTCRWNAFIQVSDNSVDRIPAEVELYIKE